MTSGQFAGWKIVLTEVHSSGDEIPGKQNESIKSILYWTIWTITKYLDDVSSMFSADEHMLLLYEGVRQNNTT
jgi:hypothetical protein